jgi:dsDNA-specific endonuclease/ATPase MutS2
MEMNAMSGQGQSSCKKPSSKGGKMKMKGMKEMQEQLGKELEKMKNSMEKMRSQGNGQKQEQGQYNKELAKMAAQQEAIRNELQKYKERLLEEGSTGGTKEGENINQAINEMENIEREIINKQISRETIKRQERIVTRMLESEKAEQQREMEEKRESTEAKNQNFSNPGEEFKYKQQKHQATEILKVKPLPINYFYRGKINSYILTIEK